MDNVINNYNTYVKIPNNHGIINLTVTITVDNYIIKTYDTANLIGNDKYELLLFDGKSWRKTPSNGIDSSIFIVASINYPFLKQTQYVIEYQFFNADDSSPIIVDNYVPIVIYSQVNHNNNILYQKLPIIEVIDAVYDFQNLCYKNIMLHWDHSWDYDKDLIYYQLEIDKLQRSVELYFDQNQNSQYKQLYVYENIHKEDDILKNTQQQQKIFFDQQIFQQNAVYRYRVRAYDEYKEYSQWSPYYYFKKTKNLYGTVVVRRNYFDNLFQSVRLLPVVEDLTFSTTIKQRPMAQLVSSVYIEQPCKLKLAFNILLQHRSDLYSDFFSTVHILDNKQRLNMKTIVGKKCYSSLFGNVFVTAKNLSLMYKLKIDPTLVQMITNVRGVYLVSQLQQGIEVYLTSQQLVQQIPIQRWFSHQNNVLIGFCTIGKRFYNPIQFQLYDSNGQQKNIDNRIKIYDANGQRIYTYNQNGQFVNVYPYIQNGVNNVLDVYDYCGNLITQCYDQQGLLIDAVYTNQNIVKNWLMTGRYKIQFTQYDFYVNYIYNYSKQTDISVLYYTTQSFIQLNADSSGQWKIIVRAVRNNINLHQYDALQTIYINKPPVCVNFPFYINGQYMDNFNVIHNANPTFTFYGVQNQDNDSCKYVIQISKTANFEDVVVQDFLYHTTDIVNHTLNKTLLTDEAWYYFRVLTIDYNNDQLKQIVSSPIAQFKYQYLGLSLYGRVQRVNVIWQLLGFMAQMRGNCNIDQILTLYKHFQPQELKNEITLYKQMVQIDQLAYNITIRTVLNLINMALITQNHSTIYSNIVIQYDYYLFPKEEVYIDQFGKQQTIVIMPVPQEHYIYGKCLVYKYRIGDDIIRYDEYGNPLQPTQPIYFDGKIQLFSRHVDEEKAYKVLIMSRIDIDQVNMQCYVWNDYKLPYETDELNQIVAVANFVYMDAWLYGALQLYYPTPPTVVVTANIQQRVWQTSYNAVFNFSLAEQPTIPLIYYIYIIDDQSDTIPTISNSKRTNNQVICDLRQQGSKMTGIKYLHVRGVNVKGMISSVTTHYCVYYNNKIQKPTPLSVNGQSVVGTQRPIIQYTKSLLFYWTVVVDAIDVIDSITYELQISKDANFIDIEFYQKNITGNFFNVLAKTIPPNDYFWRVRAFDQNEFSDWSTIATIYINKSPQPPTRLSVKNYT